MAGVFDIDTLMCMQRHETLEASVVVRKLQDLGLDAEQAMVTAAVYAVSGAKAWEGNQGFSDTRRGHLVNDGYCYAPVVRSDVRVQVGSELGPRPAVRDVMTVDRLGWLDDNVVSDYSVEDTGDAYHLVHTPGSGDFGGRLAATREKGSYENPLALVADRVLGLTASKYHAGLASVTRDEKGLCLLLDVKAATMSGVRFVVPEAEVGHVGYRLLNSGQFVICTLWHHTTASVDVASGVVVDLKGEFAAGLVRVPIQLLSDGFVAGDERTSLVHQLSRIADKFGAGVDSRFEIAMAASGLLASHGFTAGEVLDYPVGLGVSDFGDPPRVKSGSYEFVSGEWFESEAMPRVVLEVIPSEPEVSGDLVRKELLGDVAFSRERLVTRVDWASKVLGVRGNRRYVDKELSVGDVAEVRLLDMDNSGIVLLAVGALGSRGGVHYMRSDAVIQMEVLDGLGCRPGIGCVGFCDRGGSVSSGSDFELVLEDLDLSTDAVAGVEAPAVVVNSASAKEWMLKQFDAKGLERGRVFTLEEARGRKFDLVWYQCGRYGSGVELGSSDDKGLDDELYHLLNDMSDEVVYVTGSSFLIGL